MSLDHPEKMENLVNQVAKATRDSKVLRVNVVFVEKQVYRVEKENVENLVLTVLEGHQVNRDATPTLIWTLFDDWSTSTLPNYFEYK